MEIEDIKKLIIKKESVNDPNRHLNHIEYQDNSNYCPPKYDVPIDDEGYLQSFTINQENEYLKFFNHYGFVIIRDVLNDQQCQASIDDIWNFILKEQWRTEPVNSTNDSESEKVKQDQPETWVKSWPTSHQVGFLGSRSVFSKTAVETRANPNIYRVYSTLLGRNDLFINHDRYGFFRPTKNILNPMPKMTPHHTEIKQRLGEMNAVKIESKNDWKTIFNVHLDLNPFEFLEETSDETRQKIIQKLEYENSMSNDFQLENNEVGPKTLNELHIQGLLNFADNKTSDGGFLVVPGFPNHFEEWAKNNVELKNVFGLANKFIIIPGTYPLYKYAVRVTARAGSLVLWNQKMAHGSSPNDSSYPRFSQFIKVSVSTYFNQEKTQLRCNKIKEALNDLDKEQFTDLQQKIIGLKSWI